MSLNPTGVRDFSLPHFFSREITQKVSLGINIYRVLQLTVKHLNDYI